MNACSSTGSSGSDFFASPAIGASLCSVFGAIGIHARRKRPALFEAMMSRSPFVEQSVWEPTILPFRMYLMRSGEEEKSTSISVNISV